MPVTFLETPTDCFLMRDSLKEFIDGTKGRIFTATFIKKDGSLRMMNCRKGVHKDLKGGVNKAAANNPNYQIVFDMQIGEYRMLNLDTVQEIKFQKERWKLL